MTLMKRIAATGLWTFVSRILGFVRDVAMASILGAGFASDAFFIAFKLPNFFRRLFAEGAFSAGFVPIVSGLLGSDGETSRRNTAEQFAAQVLGGFLPLLLIVLLLAEIAMGAIMTGLTGGFDGHADRLEFVVELGRYVFPYLVFISLVAMVSGILNALGRFSGPAFVPVLLNIAMIAALLAASGSDRDTARDLAIAVSLSGVAQLLWLLVGLRRTGFRLRIAKPRMTESMSAMLAMIGPAAIGAGITQINLLVDVLLAARFLPEGSVSWLFYADRLNQFTIGIVGVAIGTVLLPQLSSLLADGRDSEAKATQNQAFAAAMIVCVPASFALAAVPGILVSGLFERASFLASDSMATASALRAYALGLPAFILVKVITPGFLARRDTKTPLRAAMVALAVNLALNLALIGPCAHTGLALATSIAAWVNVIILWVILHRRGHFRVNSDSWAVVRRAIVGAFAMGVAIFWLSVLYLGQDLSNTAKVALIVPTGGIVYLAMFMIFGYGPRHMLRLLGR